MASVPFCFPPLSEMPHIGRNPPYILGFLGYVVLSVVLGRVDNFPGIAILRFLQGFLGSPCLATAGASIKDIYSPKTASYGLVIWVACIYCGPALGPLFASHAVDIDWRWPWWVFVEYDLGFSHQTGRNLPQRSSNCIYDGLHLVHLRHLLLLLRGFPHRLPRQVSNVPNIIRSDIPLDRRRLRHWSSSIRRVHLLARQTPLRSRPGPYRSRK